MSPVLRQRQQVRPATAECATTIPDSCIVRLGFPGLATRFKKAHTAKKRDESRSPTAIVHSEEIVPVP